MNTDVTQKRKKREPMELQLTAMIDVFSMIVIFLIFGTVFGAADIVIPKEMQIPNSESREGIDSAPRVAIEKEKVTVSLLEEEFTLATLRSPEGREGLKAKLAPLLAAYREKLHGTTVPMNLLADKETSYRDVFDVVAAFRELGFNTVFFVAMGQGGGK